MTEMTDIERDSNAAVMGFRRRIRNVRAEMFLPNPSYKNVPTVHTCGPKPSKSCQACMAGVAT